LIDQAYADPPTSTEQVMHPERYLAGDEPVPVHLPSLAVVLGNGWDLVHDGVVGEFLLALYLENWHEESDAATAVEGWGGDRCAVYYNGESGETLMALSTQWDTPTDARQFRDAYAEYADARFGHEADVDEERLACWQEMDALCMTWEGVGVTVVLGPRLPLVQEALSTLSPSH